MPSLWKFFTSEIDVCQSCRTNENLDIQKLKNYFEENESAEGYTVQEISVQTGINSRNLNRFLINDEFSGYMKQGSSK